MRSKKILDDFIKFCKKHPELRFWQALNAWTGKNILVDKEDPFYWESKIK